MEKGGKISKIVGKSAKWGKILKNCRSRNLIGPKSFLRFLQISTQHSLFCPFRCLAGPFKHLKSLIIVMSYRWRCKPVMIWYLTTETSIFKSSKKVLIKTWMNLKFLQFGIFLKISAFFYQANQLLIKMKTNVGVFQDIFSDKNYTWFF